MTSLLTQLATTMLPPMPQGAGTVSLRLTAPLPAAALPPAGSPAQPLTLTVVAGGPPGQSTLQLPTGETVTAQLQPPLAPGSQLTLAAPQLRALSQAHQNEAGTAPAAATGAPTPPVLTARVTPPPASALAPLTPTSPPATAAPLQPPAPGTTPTATPTPPGPASTTPLRQPTPAAPAAAAPATTPHLPLANIIHPTPTHPLLTEGKQSPLPPKAGSTGTTAQETGTGTATGAAFFPSKAPAAPLIGTSKTLIDAIKQLHFAKTLANKESTLPAGPLALSFKQPLRADLLNTPATLTLTAATGGILTAPGKAPQPVQLENAPPLPQRTPLPVMLVSPAANSAPLALLTEAVAMPRGPTPPSFFTPPALSSLRVLLSGTTTTELPTQTPLTARVSTQPLQAGPFSGQKLHLASGHSAVLQSPQIIPEGSTLVVEFPTVAGVGQVLRVQPAGQPSAQPQFQGQTAGQPATGAPAAAPPATPLPAGLVVQGTLTLSAQAEPQLTISQPSPFAGQTLPLNLADNLHTHIPAGSKLTVRIEASGAPASLVDISLPPSAERAQTLTTLGNQWDSLQQGLNLLSAQSPALAQSLRANLPQLAALLPGLITFTEALRRKDTESIFGKPVAATLRAMGVDLSSDVHQLSQLQQPQPDTSWRGTLFPYVEATGQDPRQGGFFWRREKKDDARGATPTRFIMQLSLSQMGAVQLDGLVNYPNLWLKLRRTTPAEPGFVEGLQTLVASTLESYGLSGGIAVEVNGNFPVDPLAEMLSGSPNPLPTTA